MRTPRALLKFEPGAAIDEHAADYQIDLVCLQGTGFTKVGAELLEGRTKPTDAR
jgi:quercetin dioxygenase-like cupin family protein